MELKPGLSSICVCSPVKLVVKKHAEEKDLVFNSRITLLYTALLILKRSSTSHLLAIAHK